MIMFSKYERTRKYEVVTYFKQLSIYLDELREVTENDNKTVP
jgi:hypothetical protein